MTPRSRTFLKLGPLVVELGDKPIKLGRASACDIVIDDDLSSREHCEVFKEGDKVILVDLQSRNGVLLNGALVQGRAELHHADCITVGRQQVMVVRQQRAPREVPSARPASFEDDDAEVSGMQTQKGSVFEILAGALRNALASGDLSAAETSASAYFQVIRSRARGGLPSHVPGDAIEIGIALAEAGRTAAWLDQALEVAAVTSSVLDARTVDRILELASAVGRPSRGVQSYLQMANASAPGDEGAARLARLG